MSMQLLTFVLALHFFTPLAFATQGTSPDVLEKKADSSKETPASTGQEIDDNNLMLPRTDLPATSEVARSFYYPFRQELAPRAGLVLSTDSAHPVTYLLGITYLWPRFQSPQAELGADILPDYGGHLNFGVRHIFRERDYFRPFFLWGLTHEAVARDGLATLTNFDNYYLRGSVGFENVIRLPQSVRIELEARAGLAKQLLILCVGAAWGF